MLLPSGLSYHLLCTGLHIQMTLLAEVIEFAFISQKQLRDKKKKLAKHWCHDIFRKELY